MKYIFIFFSALFSITFLTAQNRSDFNINGTVKNIDNHQIVYLRTLKADQNIFVNIDSVKIENGQFEFQGNIENISYASFYIGKDKYPFFLEKGNIKANLEKTNQEEHEVKTSVTGTKTNDEFNAFSQKLYKLQSETSQYRDKNQDELTNAILNQDQKKLEQFSEEFSKYVNKISTVIDQQLANNPNSYTSLVILYQKIESNLISKSNADALFSKVKPSLKNSNIGMTISKLIDEMELTKVRVGDIAPDFSGKNPQGKTITLNNNLGKVTIVHFWAPWCPACRAKIHFLQEAYLNFKQKGLNIISICVGEDGEEWRSEIKEYQLDWFHISDLAPIQDLYGIQTIPTLFILDKNGKVLEINNINKDLYNTVQKHLNN
ncbi:TlpA disulfide reductase family protein [Myroides indicus]|uniref:Peroxiredoxin n=1 Tax=Myroides indicus TaxID=1323422 RepID=A0A4R7F3R0_9FLAO|nr:TlpA disulfide reductase family protein [Myroides indicus]TDS64160.1 peroxiredoxin [Myroides indicus]